MTLAARRRPQDLEGKWGRKENLTHLHQKNAKESKKAEEEFALLDFQPKRINQNGMRCPEETRSDARREGSRSCSCRHSPESQRDEKLPNTPSPPRKGEEVSGLHLLPCGEVLQLGSLSSR